MWEGGRKGTGCPTTTPHAPRTLYVLRWLSDERSTALGTRPSLVRRICVCRAHTRVGGVGERERGRNRRQEMRARHSGHVYTHTHTVKDTRRDTHPHPPPVPLPPTSRKRTHQPRALLVKPPHGKNALAAREANGVDDVIPHRLVRGADDAPVAVCWYGGVSAGGDDGMGVWVLLICWMLGGGGIKCHWW